MEDAVNDDDEWWTRLRQRDGAQHLGFPSRDGRQLQSFLTDVLMAQQSRLKQKDEGGTSCSDRSECIWTAMAPLIERLTIDDLTTSPAPTRFSIQLEEQEDTVLDTSSATYEESPSLQDDDHARLTVAQRMSSLFEDRCLPTAQSHRVVDEFVRELASERSVDSLSVRVSWLLALQQRKQRWAVELVESEAVLHWEREICKLFNSLTSQQSGDGGAPHELLLRRFAALHPFYLLETIVQDVIRSDQHHSLLYHVLVDCPLLTTISSSAEESQSSALVKLLRCAANRLHSLSDDSHFMAFLLLLTGVSSDNDQSVVSLVSLVDLVECVLMPELLCHGESDSRNALLGFTNRLLRSYIDKSVRVQTEIASKWLVRSLSDLCCAIGVDAEARDRALDLVATIASLAEHPAGAVACAREKIGSSNRSMHLCTLLFPDARSAIDASQSSETVLSIEELESKVEADHQTLCLSESETRRFDCLLRWLLWSGFWMWKNRQAWKNPGTEHYRDLELLKQVASYEFKTTNAAIASNAVSLRMQNVISRELCTVGRQRCSEFVLFVAAELLSSIENVAIKVGLTLPTGISSTVSCPSDEQEESLSLELSHPLQLMRFVCKCWSLVAAEAVESKPVMLPMDHVFSFVDQAVESSRQDPVALLYCLDTIGYLAVAHRRHVGGDLLSRIEVTAMRVLHLLRTTKPDAGTTTQAKAFVRSYTAWVLHRSGLGELTSVKQMLPRSIAPDKQTNTQ
ncbi:hypothetical protein PINS_up008749 [Pythium insidiosum]|nr:hypothetical protein PINS_up008749 [Pythium insidiosum]